MAKAKSPAATVKRQDTRYRDNPEYRERLKRDARRRYRARVKVVTGDCKQNLSVLSTFGIPRALVGSDGTEVVTFTQTEASLAMGYKGTDLVRRWVANGQLPEMTKKALQKGKGRGGNDRYREVRVYTLQQLTAIMQVLATHQKFYCYYRAEHTDTREAIYSAFSQIN